MKYTSKGGKVVYAEDIECVWEPRNGKGSIYVGNLQASENLRTLKKHGIKSILTAAKDIHLSHPKSEIPLHLHIPGLDHERFDLSPYFQEAISFIDQSLSQTNILVHCMAGVSRSVTLVLAYLMKHHNMSYNEAFNAVRRKRRIINPNRGFIQQLQTFERKLNEQNKVARRSCDNYVRDDSAITRSHRGENLQNRSSLLQSAIVNPQARVPVGSHLKTDANFQREPACYYNSKYKIERNRSSTNYLTSADVNKELDSKIASIRQKYMEATDLLAKVNQNRGGYANRSTYAGLGRDYSAIVDRSGLGRDYSTLVDRSGLGREYTAIADRNSRMRGSSIGNFFNSRMRQGYSFIQNY